MRKIGGRIVVVILLCAMLFRLTPVYAATSSEGVGDREPIENVDCFDEEEAENEETEDVENFNDEADEDNEEENMDNCDDSEEISADEMLLTSYNITANWGDYYNLEVSLLNISGDVIDDWGIGFDFDGKIENIWNAQISNVEENEVNDRGESNKLDIETADIARGEETEAEEDEYTGGEETDADKKYHYIIDHVDWNQDIGIEKEVTFGITVRCENGEIELPENVYLTRELVDQNPEDYEIQYTEYSRWQGHVNGAITVENKGEKTIRDWKLDIKFKDKLVNFQNVWNAKLIEDEGCDGEYIQLDNDGRKQNIKAGESVTFGFIAECSGDLEMEDSILYSMEEVEYEDGENVNEITPPESEDWEPEYDLDDFDTVEEYEQYLESISDQIELHNKAMAEKSAIVENKLDTTKETKKVTGLQSKGNVESIMENAESIMKEITPVVRTTMSCLPRENGYVKAFQSYLWDGDNLMAQFSNVKTSKMAAYLCRFHPISGVYGTDQSKAEMFGGLGHGQTFERFSVSKNRKKYKCYMVCGGAGYDNDNTIKENAEKKKPKNIVLINKGNFKEITKDNKKYYKNMFRVNKRIVGLGRIKLQKQVRRVEAALSANGKYLVVWAKMKGSNKRQISIFDMTVIKEYLYNKNHLVYNMGKETLKKRALVANVYGSASVFQPNMSLQSIEISNPFGEEKDSWNVYITSGNEGKRKEDEDKKTATVSKIKITKGSENYSDRNIVHICMPYTKEGRPLLNEPVEIEGCHIKGNELQFILTSSKQKKPLAINDKGLQFIVGIKKKAIKN